jgi:hypothetical protein
MLLGMLKDRKALASVSKVPGEGRWSENIRAVGTLEENVVDVVRGVVRLIRMEIDNAMGRFLV